MMIDAAGSESVSSKNTDSKIDQVIQELDSVTKNDLLKARAKRFNVEFVDLDGKDINPDIIYSVPESLIRRYTLMPFEKVGMTLSVAMKDPTDLFAVDDLNIVTSLNIEPFLADYLLIENLIDKYYKPVVIETVVETAVIANTEIKAKSVFASAPIAPASAVAVKSVAAKGDLLIPGLFKSRLGEMLIGSGTINQQQLETALKIQQSSGGRIGEILLKQEFIQKEDLYKALEIQLEIPYINLADREIPIEVVSLISANIARRENLFPFEREGMMLKVAMSDPTNIFAIDDLRLVTGLEIRPFLSDDETISALIDKYYEKPAPPPVKEKPMLEGETAKKTGKAAMPAFATAMSFDEELKKVNQEIAVEIADAEEEENVNISDVQNAPIVKMVNLIFTKAAGNRASDIHIEPYEDCVVVRNRVDGQLIEVMRHERRILQTLVARIKIVSGLNIAEKRVPQDGRIAMQIGGKSYDMRVSILPTMFGEKVVIRLADKEAFAVDKRSLGFFEEDLQKFEEILSHPHGIVLVTGPTGSGKSTTLYSALREISKPNINILTVEDPVENTIRGINQVQVNVKAGLTFASALRAFLRQDPDIIMVGEIRDGETAEIAIRAAITGHLVLSTLHTNDTTSSVVRMIDMGIEPFLISSSIVGVVAQRLVRRLCVHCKEEYSPGINEAELLGLENNKDAKIYMPRGCPDCNDTGYSGRIAVYEVMTINAEMREMISKNVNSEILKACAVKNGMKTLRDNCIRFVREGTTSMDEMYRVVYTKD